MTSLREVFVVVPGLTEAELASWMAQDFIRPARDAGEPHFTALDIARIRLIRELQAELEVEETTLPLVLSLLDQLYAARHHLRLVLTALDGAARVRLAAALDAAMKAEPDN